MDFFDTALVLNYVSIVSAFAVGVFRWKSQNRDQHLLMLLLCLVLLTEVAGKILWHLGKNNLFLYHFYCVGEFTLLALLYERNLVGLIESFYIRMLIGIFVSFAVVNTLFYQPLTEFNSNTTFVGSLLLIILSMLYFYKLLRDLEHRKLERVPMFWINMSVLSYFSGALMLFHVANELIPLPEEERTAIWGTHSVFNIVHYVLYAIALTANDPVKAVALKGT
jgi:hypothetical protein